MHGLTRAQRRQANELRDLARAGSPHRAAYAPAQVTAVATGAAADGNALVSVDWRGTVIEVAYLSSYSPAVGHTVLLLVQGSQVVIVGRLIGTP